MAGLTAAVSRRGIRALFCEALLLVATVPSFLDLIFVSMLKRDRPGALPPRARAAHLALPALLLVVACNTPTDDQDVALEWRILDGDGVSITFERKDSLRAISVLDMAVAGRDRVARFFGLRLGAGVDLRLYPNRTVLEEEWRTIFDAPEMQFQCWMIAHANDSIVVLLSPGVWATDSCGHNGNDALYVGNVVAHELVHVLHRRTNPDPRLPGLGPSWWLVEGLATYASGQFDQSMRTAVGQTLRSQTPPELDQIMSRADGYALAASLIGCIDRSFGRARLVQLMRAGNEAEILMQLGLTETALIADWRNCVVGN